MLEFRLIRKVEYQNRRFWDSALASSLEILERTAIG